MCFGDPSKSLAIARTRTTPEQWAKFEADFEHFCAYSGLDDRSKPELDLHDTTFAWGKWAYFSARPYPQPLELTDWMPCTTPPVRDGWYDVWRGAQLAASGVVLATIPERVRFRDGKWDRESCESKVGIWPSWDCWRGVKGEAE